MLPANISNPSFPARTRLPMNATGLRRIVWKAALALAM